METRISTITLGVADMPRLIRFYRDGLVFSTKANGGTGIESDTVESVRHLNPEIR